MIKNQEEEMSGTYACRLICKEGVFYLAFSETSGTFVSPPFKSAMEFAEFAAKNLTLFGHIKGGKDEWLEEMNSTQRIYKITTDVIHRSLAALAKLKLGEMPSDGDIYKLCRFCNFLDATVSDSPGRYEETSSAVIDGWIDELGMRRQFPADWKYWDILDHAKDVVCQRKCYKHEHPDREVEEENISTPEQCGKLVGRYVSRLALIARIAEPHKRSPVEIVKAFLDKEGSAGH